MNLTINREPASVETPRPTVKALLEERGMPLEAVVVAVNGEVLRRGEWEETGLSEGDEVEIVRAVAGGSGEDGLIIAGERFSSRIFLGTGKYPDAGTMNDNIEMMLAWKRKDRPAAGVYGGLCVAPYHFKHFDELLDDMGAKVRKRNPLAENLTPPNADAFARYLASTPQYQAA